MLWYCASVPGTLTQCIQLVQPSNEEVAPVDEYTLQLGPMLPQELPLEALLVGKPLLFPACKETWLISAQLVVGVPRLMHRLVDLQAEVLWVLNVQVLDALKKRVFK